MFMDTNIVQSKINFFYLNLWNSEIFNISKLCTYVLFKTVLVRKNFVVLDICLNTFNQFWQGSTLTVVRLPRASKMSFRESENYKLT